MASLSGYCQTPVFGDGHISVDYIKSHYKNNFDVYINCDYNVNNEDSVIFALVPHESNDPLNLVIQQLNFLFLEAYVCKVDFCVFYLRLKLLSMELKYVNMFWRLTLMILQTNRLSGIQLLKFQNIAINNLLHLTF